MSAQDNSIRPVLAATLGIALFAAMDAVMKGGALAIGAYSAFLLRCMMGSVLLAPIWWWRTRVFPRGRVLRIHLVRGTVIAFMGWSFFASLVYLPLAEAIAISFVAPLIALYLARLLLGEVIRPRAVAGTVLGLVGVIVIVAGRIGRERLDGDAAFGIALVLVSAVLFAWNLILQRQQALVSSPLEASTFQNGTVTLVLGVGAPFLLVLPDRETVMLLGLAAVLAILAAMLFIWAYARSETQRLVPIEYTGFLWASLFGWLFFAEPIRPLTVAGAVLIVIGCWIATRRRTEQTAL
ncbi:EamA family transporter [Erythrobacter gaetbuli]|uniref:EamA family transporter n=1 Tax=Qipengyuania gaetbuli TaxID=266952 RepID=A0A844Y1F1_9SPHN|nr:DMT family transporter [Qipengyuania gaetbuli]MXO52210.1 EamA family transporter [Qipengyuania gaetbuli]